MKFEGEDETVSASMKIIEQRVGKNLHGDAIYYESAGTDLIWIIMPTNTGRKVKIDTVWLCKFVCFLMGKYQKKIQPMILGIIWISTW